MLILEKGEPLEAVLSKTKTLGKQLQCEKWKAGC